MGTDPFICLIHSLILLMGTDPFIVFDGIHVQYKTGKSGHFKKIQIKHKANNLSA